MPYTVIWRDDFAGEAGALAAPWTDLSAVGEDPPLLLDGAGHAYAAVDMAYSGSYGVMRDDIETRGVRVSIASELALYGGGGDEVGIILGEFAPALSFVGFAVMRYGTALRVFIRDFTGGAPVETAWELPALSTVGAVFECSVVDGVASARLQVDDVWYSAGEPEGGGPDTAIEVVLGGELSGSVTALVAEPKGDDAGRKVELDWAEGFGVGVPEETPGIWKPEARTVGTKLYPSAETLIHDVKDALNLSRDDDEPYSTAYLLSLLNTGISLVASDGYLFHEEYRIPLSSGSRIYELPVNTYAVEWVMLEGHPHYLERFDPRLYIQSGLPNLAGRPTAFAEEGETLQFNLIPSDNLVACAYLTLMPEEVESVDDEVRLPKLARDAIVHFMVYNCLLREPDSGLVAEARLNLWIAMREKFKNLEAGKRARGVPDRNYDALTPLPGQYKRVR
jgi:hypothetical protein